MTARIAPAPVSMAAIGHDERQPQSNSQTKKQREELRRETERRLAAARRKTRALPGDLDTELSLPASTLFETTLLANGLREKGAALSLPLQRARWSPPDSTLRLRDKTI